MLQSVLVAFGLADDVIKIQPFGSGLINHTWKISNKDEQYILQRINHQVFTDPGAIAANIEMIAGYLSNKHPDYLFAAPLKTAGGQTLYHDRDEGYFRLFPFVKNSFTKDVVDNAAEAFEAAKQFGRFTSLLNNFDSSRLKTTIPHFHNLFLRYNQFLEAVANGNKQRINEAKEIISKLISFSGIVDTYEEILQSTGFKKRVTHHDTKISNVLFDKYGKGLCVIDLDTIMPGYFISDVGDMMRTYLSPVSEEEKDFSKIEIRTDIYRAVVDGYYSEMKVVLTSVEKRHFFYAGKFMIYMQALRFMTDYLKNDIYYGEKYPGHNFVRAGNQLTLLEKLLEKEAELSVWQQHQNASL
ncbi:MAG: aminoglycoside phosphotransferase family protein [Lacibacter sp.]